MEESDIVPSTYEILKSFLFTVVDEISDESNLHLVFLTRTGFFARLLDGDPRTRSLFHKVASSKFEWEGLTEESLPVPVRPAVTENAPERPASTLPTLEGTIERNEESLPVPVRPAVTENAPERPASTLPTLEEVIERNTDDRFISKQLKQFVGTLERNLYDESVNTLNSGLPFTDYYGRERELTKTIETLMRIEKSHIVFTGKAGVGKTTILKMLQNYFVENDIAIRAGEDIPIILELSLTDVTSKNPSVIKGQIDAAKLLSRQLDRRIILYVDEAHGATKMSKDALKAFLGRALTGDERVHLVFATTAAESRSFMDDTAFQRRFKEIHVREFTASESIELVKQTYLPVWQDFHTGFQGISEDSYRFASKHYKLEQPHAGNPTGIKEFLEGAITHKIVSEPERAFETGFTLEIGDLRSYLKSNLNVDLIPGDPLFETKFESMWKKLEKIYIGQEGFKLEMKEEIRKLFSNPEIKNVPTWVFHGPPGAGKTYFAEVLSQVFFKDSLLTINGGEYSVGGRQLSKLIGSPTGTVGSEQQRSVLTRFIKENPHGGVIVIEEADYLDSEIVRFFTNLITDKKFSDGLGIEYDVSKFVIQMNTNIGQDYLLPGDLREKMNWEQYFARRENLVTTQVMNGESIEVVREDKLNNAFGQFISTIVEKSLPHGEDNGGLSAQEAQKQRRRMKPFYILGPNREELQVAAESHLREFLALADLDFGVQVELEEGFIEKILDLDKFEFEKGFSYINEQLEDKLYKYVRMFFSGVASTVKVSIKEEEVEINGKKLRPQTIVLKSRGQEHSFPVKMVEPKTDNQWENNMGIRKRIQSFERLMGESLYGSDQEIAEMKELLKLKVMDWNTRPVISLVGTTGNGKTKFAHSMAEALFADSNALYTISELKRPEDLNKYLRSATGYVGSMDETSFEKWFKSRLNAGGGVILLDEILSLDKHLSQHTIGEKMAVLERLKEFLDTGFLEIGAKKYDARSFVIVMTGNLFTELFEGIGQGPVADREVARIMKEINRQVIFDLFQRAGIPQEYIVRFGKIIFKGPLSKEATHGIAKMKVNQFISHIQKNINSNIEIIVSDQVITKITNEVATVTGGMKFFEQALRTVVLEPLSSMLMDIDEPIKRIDVALKDEGVTWKVNKKEVFLQGVPFEDKNGEQRAWAFRKNRKKSSYDRTPSFNDIKIEKIELSEQEKIIVFSHEMEGHWRTDVLLKRKNSADAVSIIPAKGTKGFVRFRYEKTLDISTLTTILERIVVLQAGHRAVFKRGYYSTGGGSAKMSSKKRAAKGLPKDDINRVNYQIDRILDNHLVESITRESNEFTQIKFRNFIMDITKGVADDLINLGSQSQVFDDVFQEVLNNGFIDGEKLDRVVSKIDFDQEFPNLNKKIIQSFKRHSKLEGEKKKLRSNIVEDFLKIIDIEFKKRRGEKSCMGSLNALF